MPFETFQKPARRMGRPPTNPQVALPGDHDAMTETQKRTHYSRGCRHDVCRAAASAYNKALAARKKANATGAASDAAEPAVLTQAEREQRLPALGATRRIQALMRAGHSPVQIARRSQVGVDAAWWLALGQVDDVAKVTHTRIDQAFHTMRTSLPEPMAKTRADGDRITAMSRGFAIQQGWAGPFDWRDIDRDERPQHTPSTRRRTATEATA
ncbi:hypothetical protein EV140_1956 [Microcella alkaliphila]|uniref:Uncharacterized protein n=1 Tax=Microcella alkaliphila TaxID=279828 RepID=A0A4Q7TFV6_9MICO|nr:hypothetical protein [Microcella alkaliphila]RZT59351.1 hypothetical protein EV140_1956 [Microcella alkaliphila]